jgi:hypothetical protein
VVIARATLAEGGTRVKPRSPAAHALAILSRLRSDPEIPRDAPAVNGLRTRAIIVRDRCSVEALIGSIEAAAREHARPDWGERSRSAKARHDPTSPYMRPRRARRDRLRT